MNKIPFFIFIFIVVTLSTGFVIALTWSSPTTIINNVNYSNYSNSSDYWDDLDTPADIDHNSLTGLQGGGGEGSEYYHISLVVHDSATGFLSTSNWDGSNLIIGSGINLEFTDGNITADYFLGERLTHSGDEDTYIDFLYNAIKLVSGGVSSIYATPSLMEINNAGIDYDLRFRGLNDDALFYLDAGNDRIGIGTPTPSTKLEVDGNFTASTGFFDFLGSVSNWITELWVSTINVKNLTTGNLSVSDKMQSDLDFNNHSISQVDYLGLRYGPNPSGYKELKITSKQHPVVGDDAFLEIDVGAAHDRKFKIWGDFEIGGDFTSGTFTSVGTFSSPESVITNHNFDYRLAFIGPIAGQTAGDYLLYTVPTGDFAVITKVFIFCNGFTGVYNSPSVSIGGNSATYNDYYPDTVLGLTYAGKGVRLMPDINSEFGYYSTFLTNEEIYLKINTASTSTTYEMYVAVFGFLAG